MDVEAAPFMRPGGFDREHILLSQSVHETRCDGNRFGEAARKDQLTTGPLREIAQVRRFGAYRAVGFEHHPLIHRRHGSDHIDGHVDRGGESRDFRRRQRAARVDAVGQDDDRFMRGGPRGELPRRFGCRVVE